MEYETLTGAEINEVIAGKPPSRTQKDEGASVRTSSVPKTGTIKAESRIPTVEKTNTDEADINKAKADKTTSDKAETQVGKKTTSGGDASHDMEKNTRSAKNSTKTVKRSASKAKLGKKSSATGHDKEKQKPSDDA